MLTTYVTKFLKFYFSKSNINSEALMVLFFAMVLIGAIHGNQCLQWSFEYLDSGTQCPRAKWFFLIAPDREKYAS
jgi:hypothetical protein